MRKKHFFWCPKNAVGLKRDKDTRQREEFQKKKVPKMDAYICLPVKKDQEVVPDSAERSTLQMAATWG